MFQNITIFGFTKKSFASNSFQFAVDTSYLNIVGTYSIAMLLPVCFKEYAYIYLHVCLYSIIVMMLRENIATQYADRALHMLVADSNHFFR
jgi:hypothetical protein